MTTKTALTPGEYRLTIAKSYTDPEDGRVIPVDARPHGYARKVRPESLPRVLRIFSRATGNDSFPSGPAEYLCIEMSETISTAALLKGLQLSDPKTNTRFAVKLSKEGRAQMRTACLAVEKSAFSPSRPLKLTIGTDVGADQGTRLDGKYTGVPGSGPFSAELTPDSYPTREQSWKAPSKLFAAP